MRGFGGRSDTEVEAEGLWDEHQGILTSLPKVVLTYMKRLSGSMKRDATDEHVVSTTERVRSALKSEHHQLRMDGMVA